MNYYEKKLAEERKKKKIGAIALAIMIFLVLVFSVFSLFVPEESWKYYLGLPKLSARQDGELRIHFLDVGQADSTLVEFPDGKTLLIDGGDVDGAEKVLRYLNALKIKRLDYLLLTHTDTDHCGSLAEVVKYKEIGTAILPYIPLDYEGKAAFENFSEALAKSDAETKQAKRYFSFGSDDENYPYEFSILFPYSAESGGNDKYKENELSTISWLDYQGVNALFCGDTNADVLEKLCLEDGLGVFSKKGIDLKSIEILKYPHHGGADGATKEILQYFNVQTSIISCGRNNYYGHPSSETLSLLANSGVDVYRTDKQGDIRLTVLPNGSYNVESN
jgi:competence protein ComEC